MMSVDSSRRIEGNQDAFNSTFPDRGTDSDYHSDRPFQSLLISDHQRRRQHDSREHHRL